MPIIDSGYVPMTGRGDYIVAADTTAKSNQSNTLRIATERKARFAEVAALIAAENKPGPAGSAAKPAPGPSCR